MEKGDIKRLAELARIEVSDEEAASLTGDIDAVLDYVSTVSDITADAATTKKVGVMYNVMRIDEVTNEAGACTEDLLAEAPARSGNYLEVKKILHND